jgi:hypothetical protein
MKIYVVKRQDGTVVGVYSNDLREAAVDHVSRINGELEEKEVTLSEAVRVMAKALSQIPTAEADGLAPGATE